MELRRSSVKAEKHQENIFKLLWQIYCSSFVKFLRLFHRHIFEGSLNHNVAFYYNSLLISKTYSEEGTEPSGAKVTGSTKAPDGGVGTLLGTFTRAAGTLRHWTISPDPTNSPCELVIFNITLWLISPCNLLFTHKHPLFMIIFYYDMIKTNLNLDRFWSKVSFWQLYDHVASLAQLDKFSTYGFSEGFISIYTMMAIRMFAV